MRLLPLLLLLLASDELFDAARKGDLPAVQAAIDKGTPIESTWRYGQTALFIAASRGHVDIAKYLLDKGANPNVKDTFYGMTPLQLALQKDSADVITLLLDKGARGADELLQIAAAQGREATVAALVKRPGYTPETLSKALSAAEANKRESTAKLLREATTK